MAFITNSSIFLKAYLLLFFMCTAQFLARVPTQVA
jgi:hypothetical protein